MSAPGVGAATGQRVAVVGGDATTLARLARAAEARQDLKALVPFWTDVYRVQFAAREALTVLQGTLHWTLRRDRLLAGQPQLESGDLPLDPALPEAWVRALTDVWRSYDSERSLPSRDDWPARLRAAFQDPSLMFGQRRDLGFAETLTCLALTPWLEWAAGAVAPSLEGEGESWGRGVCPVCGGLPDLAALVGDPASRSLVCSRCSTPWPYPRVGCPFCGDVDAQVYYESEGATHRLYCCPRCRRYLKAVDTRPAGGTLDPWAERLLTIDVDLAALEAGYGPR